MALRNMESSAMLSMLMPKLTRYIPHKPTPKQLLFLKTNQLEVFYGGAVGGGKSDALLMAALQYVDIPNYSALLLRDSYTNLAMDGALLDRANDWLSDSDAHWNDTTKSWTFPTGARLTFGYLAGPRDHLNYKSAEFQFIGMDEASDLRWKQILYMFSRLRRTEDIPVPLRYRLASNPGGISHEELKNRYINPHTREKGAIFIPAGLQDNPYLNSEEYTKNLMHLDPITREQLLHGDWDVRESGRMFQREWFRVVHSIPESDIVKSVRYWDLAATEESPDKDPAWTVGLRMHKMKDNSLYIDSIIRFRKSPRYVEQIIRQTADTDGKNVHIWMEQEPGSSGKNTIDNYRRNILPDMVFKGDRVSGSKIDRAMPFASQSEAGNIFVVASQWTGDFLEEAELFPDGKYKDQVDAASGAFDKLFTRAVDPQIRII